MSLDGKLILPRKASIVLLSFEKNWNPTLHVTVRDFKEI